MPQDATEDPAIGRDPAPNAAAAPPVNVGVLTLEYLVVFAMSALLLRLPALATVAPWLFPAFLLGSALWLADRSGRPLAALALAFGGLFDGTQPLRLLVRPLAVSALRESAAALLLALVVFPPYVLGYWVIVASASPFHAPLSWEWGPFFFSHLIAAALPEEALFRGYFQSMLEARFPPTRRFLGALTSPIAWCLQALFFAGIHLASGSTLARLAVFFPGLLFGWLRAKRGGIGAAIVFHALANLLGAMLERGFHPTFR